MALPASGPGAPRTCLCLPFSGFSDLWFQPLELPGIQQVLNKYLLIVDLLFFGVFLEMGESTKVASAARTLGLNQGVREGRVGQEVRAGGEVGSELHLPCHHCRQQLSLAELYSPCAGHLVKHFTHIILFNPLSNPAR